MKPKQGKPSPPVNEPPEEPELAKVVELDPYSHTAAKAPRPTETVKLVGLVIVSGGILRVVDVELPVDEVNVLAARLPAENALERINLEVRNMYMRAIDRRPRGG